MMMMMMMMMMLTAVSPFLWLVRTASNKHKSSAVKIPALSVFSSNIAPQHPPNHATSHVSGGQCKSPSIALMSTWYIFADPEVFVRRYVLRHIRLQSLVVNFHLALIERNSIQNFLQICIHAWKEANADLNIRYAKK